MSQILGEFDCKIDAKGRMRLPSTLLKKLVEGEGESFVINRGFEKCLVLYTKKEWEKITYRINKLNTYVKKNREFVRYFYRGATEVTPDSADRVLLTKRLLEYAGIDKEVVLAPIKGTVEIWARERFDRNVEEEPENFEALAEDVMGDLEDENEVA
ncbi:MAG: division/cell wall cluster transcriptional repressor MraZ [Saprospiraceae bacterium]